VNAPAQLAAASERLRDVPGFPKRAGRPRKAIAPPAPPPAPRLRELSSRNSALAEPAAPPLVNQDDDDEKTPAPRAPALPPRLLGPRDAGTYLGTSAWSVRKLVERGDLRLVKLPGLEPGRKTRKGGRRCGGRWLIDVRDLDALIEKAKA